MSYSTNPNSILTNTNINIKQAQSQQPRCLSFIIQKYIEKPMLI